MGLAQSRVSERGPVEAVALAEALLVESRRREGRAERRRRARLARLLADPDGRSFTLALTDEVVRIRDRRRAARRFADLVAERGVPTYPGPVDRLALRLGARLAPALPSVVMPLVVARLRRESAGVILPAEDRPLTRHLARRRREGIRVNVNVLGEAVLGDDEAARRLAAVQAVLARPDVDYVSVKASALCAQLEVLAFDEEVARVAEPLRALYRAAGAKFVNLDMEEHRDLELTVAVFRTVLDEPEFAELEAGIVLQAYLPDSVAALDELCAWASGRRGRIKVRIVKGANLAMERVDAELHGWPQAPYATKAEVDANYKRMVERAVDSGAVRVGVASHNLLDVAWALGLGSDRVEPEMLEGMADGEARAVRAAAGNLLFYTPVARHDDFESAIAYLVRRLDENTAPENFLRASFDLEPGSEAWATEVDRFEQAVTDRHRVPSTPRRTQDRATEERRFGGPFANEPDTDWSLAANRRWIAPHLADPPAAVTTTVTLDDVDRAVATARAADHPADRRALLHRVAEVLAANRGRLLAVMAHEAGKTVLEGDPEVSEAVDFANFYAGSIDTIDAVTADGPTFHPYRVVVVASPWNFPLAIPAGMVAASLVTGNAVLFKPAEQTPGIASRLVAAFHRAGVPPDVLAFLPGLGEEAGAAAVADPRTTFVAFVGSRDVGRSIMAEAARPKPGQRQLPRVIAELGGKNPVVIDEDADLDVAVPAVIASAFGYAGQKCSAASRLIVPRRRLDETVERLVGATRLVAVGQATDLRTVVGPLIEEGARERLRRYQKMAHGSGEVLIERDDVPEDGWFVGPQVVLVDDPTSPIVRDEIFGPLLCVQPANDFDEALALANDSDYALTAGVFSRSPGNIRRAATQLRAGNVYINRGTTGALVGRQPFGGYGMSGVGSKAGGADYLLQFVDPRVITENTMRQGFVPDSSDDATGDGPIREPGAPVVTDRSRRPGRTDSRR
jgi:RHH-type proline utilization regulon transcriptional repressor/proline dehydrogenase/delta 1-pyrroline-5-carboxylate dehydrogenase